MCTCWCTHGDVVSPTGDAARALGEGLAVRAVPLVDRARGRAAVEDELAARRFARPPALVRLAAAEASALDVLRPRRSVTACPGPPGALKVANNPSRGREAVTGGGRTSSNFASGLHDLEHVET
jgi:hypothetical protein